MNRLFCLLLLFGLAASSAAQDDATTHEIVAGPMIGPTTETTAAIWLQLDRPGSVMLRYRPLGSEAWSFSRPISARRENGNCVIARVQGLEFGVDYEFDVAVNLAQLIELKPRPRFRTRPHWNFRSEPPDFSVAFGSCAYINDQRVDRPGREYGGDPAIFSTIAASKPDLMLWLGDNVYFREPDWSARSAMVARYSYARRLPELQPLLRATSHLAIWDDHDYGSNDSDWTFPGRRDALDVFKTFWANPQYGLQDTPGVFGRYAWGDVEFFLLDGRYHRSPNRKPQGPDKTMHGAKQLNWLLDSLSSSTARFKIVCCGGQMLNPLCFYEGLGRYEHERRKLLAEIRRREIRGLVFLSGDRHHAELIRIDRPGTYPLHDFTSSPLTSGLHRVDRERENPARVPGTLLNDRRNFGLLHFSGKRRDRKLTLELRDAKGQSAWTYRLRDRDLGWPGQ
jgi:alkaline phosphatase D